VHAAACVRPPNRHQQPLRDMPPDVGHIAHDHTFMRLQNMQYRPAWSEHGQNLGRHPRHVRIKGAHNALHLPRLMDDQVLSPNRAVPPEFYRASAWTERNATLRAMKLISHASDLGLHCPKVATANFWYPSLGRWLRGLGSIANISAGETVIRVPFNSVLSETLVLNSGFKDAVQCVGHRPANADTPLASLQLRTGHAESSFSGATMIAMFIIREGNRPFSPWMPYIKGSLNGHNVSNLPMSWEPGSRNLKGATEVMKKKHAKRVINLQRFLTQKLACMIQTYPQLLSHGLECPKSVGRPKECNKKFLLDLYSVRRVRDMVAVVMARFWYLKLHGFEQNFMLPAIDMLNFGQVGLRLTVDPAKKGVVLVATQAIPAGRELLFMYGVYCQENSLLEYGFSTPTQRPCRV